VVFHNFDNKYFMIYFSYIFILCYLCFISDSSLRFASLSLSGPPVGPSGHARGRISLPTDHRTGGSANWRDCQTGRTVLDIVILNGSEGSLKIVTIILKLYTRRASMNLTTNAKSSMGVC
jgi:hypothetical protein